MTSHYIAVAPFVFFQMCFVRPQTRLVVPLSVGIFDVDRFDHRPSTMDYVIHPLTTADEPVLWEMLYQALRTSADAPPRDIVREPKYARHVEGWGREGDTGFVAYDAEKKDELLGAAWLRLPPGQRDVEPTPELAFAVTSGHRKRGIGAALLTQLVKTNPHYSAVSISAGPNNPVVRLFDRFGFKIVQQKENAVTLRREI
jgi:GNAT superfamily N-acetyltransferase